MKSSGRSPVTLISMHWFDKFAAIVRRDLLTAIRYRASFVLAAAGGAVEIAGLYYLSKAIGPNFRPNGMDSYPFLLVGTGLYSLLLMGISCFVSAVQEAQQAGTLEVLMTSSTSPSLVLFLSATSSFAGKGLSFLIYLIVGLLISQVRLLWACCLPACLVLALSMAVAAAIGTAAAGVQLTIQKGSGMVWLLGSAVCLLTGAMFPVSTLPRSVQTLANLIPFTHSIAAMRMALVSGGFSAALLQEIAVLAGFALVLLPLSLLFFAEALRHARLRGTLSYS